MSTIRPMPLAPLRPCPAAGCRALTRGGRCPAHQRAKQEAQWKQADANRASSHARGYDAAWRRLRSLVLSQEPLCRSCSASGRTVPATLVDHITPIARGGSRLDRANLQPLCATCHGRKTAAEDGGFGNESEPRERTDAS